jgi:hypothetical protein
MPKNSGQTNRDLFSSHGAAGKGDADRSPKWRDHYDEIDWHHRPDEFKQVRPGLKRKIY